MKIRDRIKEMRRVPSSELLPNPKNWRTHPESQANALRGVLSDVGIADAVLARETPEGLMLIDGHLRVETMPDTLIPVLVLDVDEDEADKILLTKDPLSTLAVPDPERLGSLMESASFESDAVREMLAQLALSAGVDAKSVASVEEDDVPSIPKESPVIPNDIWVLGKHRLLCGSCCDMDAMSRLFSGALARMIHTDPPYNVDYTGGSGLKIENDSMDGEAFLQFLKDAFVAMAAFTEPGSATYIWHADSEGENFRRAMRESGFEYKQCLVWVKSSLVMGRQDYHWRHEPVLYGWRSGGPHRFYGGRKSTTVVDNFEGVSVVRDGDTNLININFNGRSVVLRASDVSVEHDGNDEHDTVWRFEKPKKNGDHPTMKPLSLCARAISHGSQRGDIVLDGFLGSGSTLIAAEQLGRVCYGAELSPLYASVILDRWSAVTGGDPVNEETGKRWSEVKHGNDAKSKQAF